MAIRSNPSAERNKGPIGEFFSTRTPFSSSTPGAALEIGSGTGQHAAEFAARFPHVKWQPTEYCGGSNGPEEPAHGTTGPVFDCIKAWTAQLSNVEAPLELDAAAETWPAAVESSRYDAIFACNVAHISPFAVTTGLLRGASRLLAPDGRLFLYGPFMVDGKHTAPSNQEFDARLRAQNPAWGVRDCGQLAELARTLGLRLEERAEMPANNFVVAFCRSA
jgi:SAM-dependent methyltransferase